MTQPNDAILAKISNIKNSLASIQKYVGEDAEKLDDQLIQDAFVLNLERACQSAIDLANLIIADQGLMLPRSYSHSFSVLRASEVIEAECEVSMAKMAGFRNIAVHDYTKLDVAILKSILKSRLKDFPIFIRQIMKYYSNKV